MDIAAYHELRTRTHINMGLELAVRLIRNPLPDPMELTLGTYIEGIEPQVRGAVKTFYDRGYRTLSSGFHPWEHDYRIRPLISDVCDPINTCAQLIAFEPFPMGIEMEDAIEDVGADASVQGGLCYSVGFIPEQPDLDLITAKWHEIAGLFPESGLSVEPRERPEAVMAFWYNSTDLGLTPLQIRQSAFSVL